MAEKEKKEKIESPAEETQEESTAGEGNEKGSENSTEEVMSEVPSDEEIEKELPKTKIFKEGWDPKTEAGRAVLSGQITDIDELLDKGWPILEPEITEILLPNLQSDLLLIGQSKGKFGGGQRRVFRQTQKKTQEGNKPKFATYAVVGDLNGHVGIGYGKSKETVPAREKAIRNAKKSIIKIRRGGKGSWESDRDEPHSIPFKVSGKCGSTIIELLPAPKGTGLRIQSECAKILHLAGIEDVWSRTFGRSGTRINLIKALEKALKKLSSTKVQPEYVKAAGIVWGSAKAESAQSE